MGDSNNRNAINGSDARKTSATIETLATVGVSRAGTSTAARSSE
jgi:hypothetical protein